MARAASSMARRSSPVPAETRWATAPTTVELSWRHPASPVEAEDLGLADQVPEAPFGDARPAILQQAIGS